MEEKKKQKKITQILYKKITKKPKHLHSKPLRKKLIIKTSIKKIAYIYVSDHTHREIQVDSYDVTIFPAESIKNSVSKKAKLKVNDERKKSAKKLKIRKKTPSRFFSSIK